MNLQSAMVRESVESMAVVAHLALQGQPDELKTLQAFDLPTEHAELIGFLKGLKFVNDVIKATSNEPTIAKLSW